MGRSDTEEAEDAVGIASRSWLVVAQPPRRVVVVLGLSTGLVLAGAALIAWMGGTGHLNPGLLLAPILWVAFMLGPLAGMGVTLLAGLLVGPWMPLDAGEAQAVSDWLPRIAFYGASAGLVGLLSAGYRRESAQRLERERRLREQATQRLAATPDIIQQERLRALGQMASGIVHDLNNVLTPAVGYIELLLTDRRQLEDPDRTEADLGHVRAALMDATRIVQRLRSFYQSPEASDRPVDTNEVVRECIAQTEPRWRAQARQRGVAYEVETRLEADAEVRANEPDLRSVVTNLLLNAIDATPEGGRIACRTRDEGEAVVVEIADPGCGMDDETRRRCTDPFFTTKGDDGTGMGLALARSIVERLGGRLDLDSAPGRGTTVSLHLPILRPETSEVGMAGASSPPVAPRNVLVVEDEPAIRKMLRTLLERDGHRVRAMENGQDALGALDEERPDVVLTDSVVPGLTGPQLATALRARAPGVPIVLVTGFADDPAELSESSEHVACVLRKPVTLDSLRATLGALEMSGPAASP